jgi:hypothetical protein
MGSMMPYPVISEPGSTPIVRMVRLLCSMTVVLKSPERLPDRVSR